MEEAASMPFPYRHRADSLQLATAWVIGAIWILMFVFAGFYFVTQGQHDDLLHFLDLR